MNNKEKCVIEFEKGAVKKRTVVLVMVLLLTGIFIWALAVGGSRIGLREVYRSVIDSINGSETVSETQKYIALSIRIPRVLAAMGAGAALAMAGLLMQGVFQNPLVSPYTLGISNGASFGACLAIIAVSGGGSVFAGIYMTPIFAFIFAIITMLMVFALVQFSGRSTKSIILTGVAVGYLFSALVSILKYVADVKSLPELIFWTMGSLSGITWETLAIIFVVLCVCIIISLFMSWNLNVMTFGKEEALALGVDYKKNQMAVFIMTTILTAVTVSFTGVIGFIGLVAPHVSRMLVGNDYRYGIPVSCLMGSGLLLMSDTVARIIIAPTELPVGIVTSLIGVPFYIYLVLRRSKHI